MQNALLQESISEVRAAGIEPGKILPEVKLNRSTRSYGRCHKVGDAFQIALSKYYLDNPPEDLKSTLVHEVLHTVDDCFNHGPKWKSLVAKMNRIYGYNIQRTEVSRGSLNASIVHPREIFKRAILNNAAGIFLIHNHPSGNSTPSREDIETTKRIKSAGELLGINLIDHIIAGNSYYSFLENGIL